MLNSMSEEATRQTLHSVTRGRVFDLSVDYFVGMPCYAESGDPPFQIWMTARPRGQLLDDSGGVGRAQNELVSRSGDSIAMYTHCGTHVDALNHMGYRGRIWNGFAEDEYLGSRHWRVAGADKHPPVIARGVLIDVAAAQGVPMLPDSFGIGEKEIRDALRVQRTELRAGDVALIRTGRMSVWPDAAAFLRDEPGLNRNGAEFLARQGCVMIGADNSGLEQLPGSDPENWLVVHTYLLCEAGVPILEVVNLQDLSAERVYEFAFIGACLRIRGGTGSPMRPIALPIGDS